MSEELKPNIKPPPDKYSDAIERANHFAELLDAEEKASDALRAKLENYENVLTDAEMERDMADACVNELRAKLEMAKKMMKKVPHLVHHNKHDICLGCVMDEALQKLEEK